MITKPTAITAVGIGVGALVLGETVHLKNPTAIAASTPVLAETLHHEQDMLPHPERESAPVLTPKQMTLVISARAFSAREFSEFLAQFVTSSGSGQTFTLA